MLLVRGDVGVDVGVGVDLAVGMTGLRMTAAGALWLGNRLRAPREPEMAMRPAMRMAVQAPAVTMDVWVSECGGHWLTRLAPAHTAGHRQEADEGKRAEGIEEPAQLRELQREQCDHGQGFLFARPLSADAVEQFLGPATPMQSRTLTTSGPPRRSGR